ncbi:MAG: hypothetical protein CMM87_05465 [Rickettsiales bacterium]|nr:hypothetical protein [Rickettsiales bacterium]|tara:strand:+ start:2655 stop:2930 length:276 start_codon:yes stop_codon:yes gene_type:complete
MNQAQFEAAKKRFETYDLRVESPGLSVEAAYDAVMAEKVRAERDALLSATDFRMVSDAPWDKEAWASYRQSLRDLPASAGFPHQIEWPVAP